MSNVLGRAGRRFAHDQRGHAAILFAVTMVPVIGLMGGAVDFTRYTRHKAQVLNALDSAAIALTRRGAADDAEADAFVNAYAANLGVANGDPMLRLASFDATATGGGWRVAVTGAMDTAFMPVVGIGELPLDLSTEVQMSTGGFEVALALDNTGSMREHGRIEALRDAAGELVDDLYAEAGTEDRVKMALIPFVTSVNIKTPGVYDEATWIEPAGANGVDRLKLFAGMRVPFKGCVEARGGGHDEDDAEPTSAATRWVPYVWPDEPDGGYANSYLRDGGSNAGWDTLADKDKYKVRRGRRVADTTAKGPNAACPRPIVELTNDTARLHDEIDAMKPHNGWGAQNHSGTNVAQGLLWGWRVLSPDAPYQQGAAYEDAATTKVLVLLSDGRNQIVAEGNDVGSDYTSYGYLSAGRLGTTKNYLKAEKAVDGKVERICASIKAKGIRVYTILFQVDFESTQDLFRACASKDEDGNPLYYYVPDASQLETAFADIGEDLTALHVSR